MTTKAPGRNQRLAAVRTLLHDLVCISGEECSSRPDHAKRTQHTQAREVIDGGTREVACDVLHRLVHPTCEKPVEGHMNTDALVVGRVLEAAGIANPNTESQGER